MSYESKDLFGEKLGWNIGYEFRESCKTWQVGRESDKILLLALIVRKLCFMPAPKLLSYKHHGINLPSFSVVVILLICR